MSDALDDKIHQFEEAGHKAKERLRRLQRRSPTSMTRCRSSTLVPLTTCLREQRAARPELPSRSSYIAVLLSVSLFERSLSVSLMLARCLWRSSTRARGDTST